MMMYLAVFDRGMMGGTLRYIPAFAFPTPQGFPVGTLFINLSRSLMLGQQFVTQAARRESSSPEEVSL